MDELLMNNQNTIIKTDLNEEKIYSLICAAADLDYYVVYIQGKRCKSLESVFHDFSVSLCFPYYFGYNWAAFDECLTDLEWIKFSKMLIVIEDFEHICSKELFQKKQKELLLKYLEIAIEHWKIENKVVTVILN